ncbi:AAA family ATPase [Halosimplex marinum]|uniref:AAA family ATPase n=1 Tax=Halosimplex marinum TaxID=3396620 RepID=UPI003F576873
MYDRAVAVSGYAGSGKTTVSTEVANRANCHYVNVGNVVYSFARRKLGRDAPRERLQRVIREHNGRGDGAASTRWLIEVLDAITVREQVVVDGVRRTGTLERLRELFDRVEVVFLACPFEVRLRRVQSRSDDRALSAAELRRRDRREAEYGVETLREDRRYDYLVDSSQPRSEVIEELSPLYSDTRAK